MMVKPTRAQIWHNPRTGSKIILWLKETETRWTAVLIEPYRKLCYIEEPDLLADFTYLETLTFF